MDNREFSNLGDQIRDSVQNAIDSMDFNQLNRTISDTVNSALEEARSQLMKGGGVWKEPAAWKFFRPKKRENRKNGKNGDLPEDPMGGRPYPGGRRGKRTGLPGVSDQPGCEEKEWR